MSKVLIGEDDLDIANLEKDYLQLSGYSVEIETDGKRALERVLAERFDILVIDLMLPGLTGFEVIKETRKKLEIPVIVVSAKTEDIDKIRGFELGADDYLVKPFSPSELVARVKSHERRYARLREAARSQEDDRTRGTERRGTERPLDANWSSVTENNNDIEIKGLEIQTQSRKVFVDGKETSFTATEYELLTFLASNPDRVFTREQLFSAVWGADYTGDLATVAVHVQKIRKKIEKDSSNPDLIETLWGTGYRFNSGR